MEGRLIARRSAAAVYQVLLVATLAGTSQARIFNVGDGRPFPNIASVPWGELGPGDLVRVHWRRSAYREKILISTRGTERRPIRVVGVPGPAGERPVIDGDAATTSPAMQFPYAGTQDRGLLIVTPNRGYRWGFKPGYLVIEGLELRNASAPRQFRDGLGHVRSFSMNAASVFVERGEHIVIRNCAINGSGNGLFVASGGSEEAQSRDILVEGCDIRDNGNVGRDREHNVYTEAIGIIFQYNRLGPPRGGSLGNNLKDRSAGTVVRYNWIENGAHLLDLVEPEESYAAACKARAFSDTFVYGNVLISGPGPQTYVVHYGGDNGRTSTYRKGVLHFYHNTVSVIANQTGPGGRWRTVLLRLETDDETADARNNILHVRPATAGVAPTEVSLLNIAGLAVLGMNWITPGWLPTRTGVRPTGRIEERGRLLGDDRNDPGFVDAQAGDYRLKGASNCLDCAGPLDSSATATHPLLDQFAPPRGRAPRVRVGVAPDLGAFEGPAQSSPTGQ